MARPSRIRATVIVASLATGIGVWIWRAPEPQPLRRFAIPSPSGAPPLEASISFSEADLDYWMVELGPRGLAEAVTATPRPFLRQSRRQHDLEISPDGRFAAYISAEGGIFTGFVTRFPSAEGKWELPILTRIPSGGLTGNDFDRAIDEQQFLVPRSPTSTMGAATVRVFQNFFEQQDRR